MSVIFGYIGQFGYGEEKQTLVILIRFEKFANPSRDFNLNIIFVGYILFYRRKFV